MFVKEATIRKDVTEEKGGKYHISVLTRLGRRLSLNGRRSKKESRDAYQGTSC